MSLPVIKKQLEKVTGTHSTDVLPRARLGHRIRVWREGAGEARPLLKQTLTGEQKQHVSTVKNVHNANTLKEN